MVDDEEEYRPRRSWTDPTENVDPSPGGPEASAPPSGDTGGSGGRPADPDATTVLRRVPGRRSPGPDPDATTLLPRTSSGARPLVEDDDDFDAAPAPGARLRTALLVGAVAAIVAIGLAIGYGVISATERPGVAPSAPPGSTAADPAGPSATPAALLTDGLMLTGRDALAVDDDRAWKVNRTQRGLSPDVEAACLGGEPVEGQPEPQQVIQRLVTSNGSRPPGILHRADAYSSPEEAAQAYAVAAKRLGGCEMPATFVEQGQVIGGVGDQAVGVVLRTNDGSGVRYRSVGLARTGRVLNVVDVTSPERAVRYSGVTRAMAAAVARQCRPAGGRCNADVNAKKGPPPIGGDEPGFLAAADLPPAGKSRPAWVGTAPAAPKPEFNGSGCETVTWSTVPARGRSARTFLQKDGSPTFGLDQVVVTTASAKAAGDLVDKIKKDLDTCSERQLTAKVSNVDRVRGTGARGAELNGYTALVTQSTENGPRRYRVGIVSAGPKAVYTFLNPQAGLDFSDAEFDLVAVRAAERASQVR